MTDSNDSNGEPPANVPQDAKEPNYDKELERAILAMIAEGCPHTD